LPGLQLAMDIEEKRNTSKQIFMITDGKPSCVRERDAVLLYEQQCDDYMSTNVTVRRNKPESTYSDNHLYDCQRSICSNLSIILPKPIREAFLHWVEAGEMIFLRIIKETKQGKKG
jgi:hypothetical protein